MNLRDSRGFTLTELLVVIVIASVMIFAFAMPFVAERIFWRHGNQQTEAQRDAQMVMHAIAYTARGCQSTSPSVLTGQPQVTLTNCACRDTNGILTGNLGDITFQGGPTYNGQFQKVDRCTNITSTLVDGVRSKVIQFAADEFRATAPKNPLLHLTLQVDHKDSGTELLETRILLRNAS